MVALVGWDKDPLSFFLHNIICQCHSTRTSHPLCRAIVMVWFFGFVPAKRKGTRLSKKIRIRRWRIPSVQSKSRVSRWRRTPARPSSGTFPRVDAQLQGETWGPFNNQVLGYGLTILFVRTCIVPRSCHLHTICRSCACQPVIVLHLSAMAPSTDRWKKTQANEVFLHTESNLDDYGRRERRGLRA
jgi:hypothetical protein